MKNIASHSSLILFSVISLSSVLTAAGVTEEKNAASTKSSSGDLLCQYTVLFKSHGDNREEQLAFNYNILGRVIGSEEVARKISRPYFSPGGHRLSTWLTPKQASDLSKRPDILNVYGRTYDYYAGFNVPTPNRKICKPREFLL